MVVVAMMRRRTLECDGDGGWGMGDGDGGWCAEQAVVERRSEALHCTVTERLGGICFFEGEGAGLEPLLYN